MEVTSECYCCMTQTKVNMGFMFSCHVLSNFITCPKIKKQHTQTYTQSYRFEIIGCFLTELSHQHNVQCNLIAIALQLPFKGPRLTIGTYSTKLGPHLLKNDSHPLQLLSFQPYKDVGNRGLGDHRQQGQSQEPPFLRHLKDQFLLAAQNLSFLLFMFFLL